MTLSNHSIMVLTFFNSVSLVLLGIGGILRGLLISRLEGQLRQINKKEGFSDER